MPLRSDFQKDFEPMKTPADSGDAVNGSEGGQEGSVSQRGNPACAPLLKRVCICGHPEADHEPDGEPRPFGGLCSQCNCGGLSVWDTTEKVR